MVINDYSARKDPIVEQAEQVVRYFHKTVHAVDSNDPQSKEVGQALSLITQHGAEETKFIVEFAAARAGETNFPMQHFGAVLSYASRALAEFDRVRRLRDEAGRPQLHPAPAPARSEIRARGKRLLASLSAEQQAARFEAARAEVRQRPIQAEGQPGSRLFDAVVRSRMIAVLDEEPMDLIAFDASLAATYPWLARPAQNLPL